MAYPLCIAQKNLKGEQELTGDFLQATFDMFHDLMRPQWPPECKMPPGESVTVDVNQTETDDMTFMIYPLLTALLCMYSMMHLQPYAKTYLTWNRLRNSVILSKFSYFGR